MSLDLSSLRPNILAPNWAVLHQTTIIINEDFTYLFDYDAVSNR